MFLVGFWLIPGRFLVGPWWVLCSWWVPGRFLIGSWQIPGRSKGLAEDALNLLLGAAFERFGKGPRAKMGPARNAQGALSRSKRAPKLTSFTQGFPPELQDSPPALPGKHLHSKLVPRPKHLGAISDDSGLSPMSCQVPPRATWGPSGPGRKWIPPGSPKETPGEPKGLQNPVKIGVFSPVPRGRFQDLSPGAPGGPFRKHF